MYNTYDYKTVNVSNVYIIRSDTAQKTETNTVEN